jgi:hypothetical protein
MRFLIASLGSFLLFAALSARAQSPDPGSTPPSTATPADVPANAPASTSPEKKKPKKVWTNEEVGSIKGGVSVVGEGNSSSEKSADKHSSSSSGAEDARQKQIQDYRDRIQQYQADIEAVDKRIAELKSFKAEDTSPGGGINPTRGYNMVPVEDQVKQLEDKKKQLQAKIDDTEVDARKNGLEPGDLR